MIRRIVIPACLLIFSLGCGASARDIAAASIVATAEALDRVDVVEAEEYVRAHQRALDAATTAAEYVERMGPHRRLEDAMRVARVALVIGRAAVQTWDAGGEGRWLDAAGCIAVAIAEVMRLLEEAGVVLPDEVRDALRVATAIGAPMCTSGGGGS